MEKAVINIETYETTKFHKTFNKIFVILGKAGAGKTSITRDLSKSFDIEQIITYTTRKQRQGETNGIDYHFTTEEIFNSEDFICKEQYNIRNQGPCSYGINPTDLEKGKNVIIVLTPSGYHELKERYGDRVIGIYIMAPRQERFDRYISRDPNDKFVLAEAKRRFEADDKDFYELEYKVENIIINNKDYDYAFSDTSIVISLGMYE